MKRHREPNSDLWVAPGDKIEKDGSSYEYAARERYEEAGLTVRWGTWTLVLRWGRIGEARVETSR